MHPSQTVSSEADHFRCNGSDFIVRMLPNNVQKVLFSATFPDNVIAYAGIFAPNANQITLRHDELTVEGIKQLYLDCHDEETKFEVLLKLYGLMTIGSSIIFVKVYPSTIPSTIGY